MKQFFIQNLSNKIHVELSNKIYKITGLKCTPEELPESLYFMLSDSIFFQIPYISDQNTIINYSLQKNIALVGKILSYFELEEVSIENVQLANANANQLFEPIMKSSIYDFALKERKEQWFNSIVRKIENIIFKKINDGYDIGYISKKITKGDLEKYNEFKNNKNLYTDIMKNFISGSIAIAASKSKKVKPEDSFPNSIKKLFIDLINSYESIMFKCEEKVKFSLSGNQKNFSVDNPATNILVDILLCNEISNGNRYENNCIEFVKNNEIPNDNSIVDILNYQFDAGFKYTDKNIDTLNNVAKVFQIKTNKLYTSADNGESLFNTDDEGILFGQELFSNVDLLNSDNNNSGSGITVYKFLIRELVWECIYNYVHSVDCNKSYNYYAYDNAERRISVSNNVSTAIFLREPEIKPDYIAIKYKDMINLQWSDELTRTVTFSTKDLKESIRHRYFLTSVGREQFLNQRNMVVDTMLPQSLFNSDMNLEKTNRVFQTSQNVNTKTAYAISPLTAAAYGCKQIPIEHLCRVLGYTKESIKTMMNTVKNREYNFVLVGTGGTGNNTTIWLSRMLDMCNLPFLFRDVYAFEKETAEIHNLLRFPKDPYSITIDTGIFASINSNETNRNKCHIIASELRSLSRNSPFCYERYIAYEEGLNNAYPSNVFHFANETEPVLNDSGEVIDFKTVTKIKPKPNTVFYGAPDIATRQNLSNVGNFISATHSSNNCNMYINPEQDAMIQVESYGMIQLTPFFMNQLRMAIGLLEILSADNAVELLASKDHEFLSYKFDGETKLKNDRVYNFKIIDNPEMATETQAANNMNVDF